MEAPLCAKCGVKCVLSKREQVNSSYICPSCKATVRTLVGVIGRDNKVAIAATKAAP